MAALERPPELMPDKMREKLAEYEKLFKHRYTNKDPGYHRTCQMDEKLYQVPTLDPWPPTCKHRCRRRGHCQVYDNARGRRHDRKRRPQHSRHWDRRYHGNDDWEHSDHYDTWGQGGRRYDDYGSGVDVPMARDHRGRGPSSPPPSYYHGSHAPPPYHQHSSPPYHHYHHSHHASPPPHRQGHSPWRQASTTPPRAPRSHSPKSHETADRHHSMYSQDQEDLGEVEPPRPVFPPLATGGSPLRPAKSEEEEEGSSAKKAGEKKRPHFHLDLQEMVGLNKKEEVPTLSDVSDILAIAHGSSAGITSENLKMGSFRDGHQLHKPKQPAKEKERPLRFKRNSSTSDTENSAPLHLKKIKKERSGPRPSHLAPPTSAASVLLGHGETKPTSVTVKKEGSLFHDLPSGTEVEGLASNLLENLGEGVSKKMKKKSKKKKKKASGSVNDLEDFAKPKPKKRKRMRSDSIPPSDEGNQSAIKVDDETEDIDVTTPLVGSAPLSDTLKQSLESEERDNLGDFLVGDEGVEMLGPVPAKPKKKKHKKDGLSEPLFVRYDLNSVPRFSTRTTSLPLFEDATSDHLPSVDLPSASQLCQSKFEGDSIKMVIQCNNEVLKEKEKKKKKEKKKHKKKEDKRREVEEDRVLLSSPANSMGDQVPSPAKSLGEEVPKPFTSLKVTINRSSMNKPQ